MASPKKGCWGTGISGIMPEVVAQILARLPFSAVLSARCVCRVWRSVVDEPTFRRSYRDSACLFPDANCIQDSSGKAMRWAPRHFEDVEEDVPDWLCAVSQDKRLFLARSTQVRRLFVGSPFVNRWEEIPYLQFGDMSRVRLIATRSSSPPWDYKLVVWRSDGVVWSFTRGQAEWHSVTGALRNGSLLLVVTQDVVLCRKGMEVAFFDLARKSVSHRLLIDNPRVEYVLAPWRGKLYYLVLKNVGGLQYEIIISESLWRQFLERDVGLRKMENCQDLSYIGQAGNFMNFACVSGNGDKASFSFDLDKGTWDTKVYASPPPLSIHL